MNQYVIFTDLDGTLLNHHDYSFEAVCPLLDTLKHKGIPVILNSSKTLAEIELWQKKLDLPLPVIAENGGVVMMPGEKGPQMVYIGKPYQEIRGVLENLRDRYGWKFEGFGDWSIAEVMNHTGLKAHEAALAKDREVIEPIVWNDSEDAFESFREQLAEHDLALKRGGRFWHVMGHHDKADAMHFLVNKDYFSCGSNCTVIALGDSQNDLSMLNYANIAVVLPNEHRQPLAVKEARYINEPAPQGWVTAIEQILASELDINHMSEVANE